MLLDSRSVDQSVIANLPSQDTCDVRGMLVEERCKHVNDAAQLYNSIPRATLLATGAFSLVPGPQGMWTLSAMQELGERPRFDWNQVYNIGKNEDSLTGSAVMIIDTTMQVERWRTKTVSLHEAP